MHLERTKRGNGVHSSSDKDAFRGLYVPDPAAMIDAATTTTTCKIFDFVLCMYDTTHLRHFVLRIIYIWKVLEKPIARPKMKPYAKTIHDLFTKYFPV